MFIADDAISPKGSLGRDDCLGDFNGDGYEDIAIVLQTQIPATTTLTSYRVSLRALKSNV
ncbi:MAG: hypothetical protein CM15mP49_35590 [Actinomycetota bacterium]|nr:MAG: hypothetical protein CM15mP49_35590 [Actinomycetota bacterium]